MEVNACLNKLITKIADYVTTAEAKQLISPVMCCVQVAKWGFAVVEACQPVHGKGVLNITQTQQWKNLGYHGWISGIRPALFLNNTPAVLLAPITSLKEAEGRWLKRPELLAG